MFSKQQRTNRTVMQTGVQCSYEFKVTFQLTEKSVMFILNRVHMKLLKNRICFTGFLIVCCPLLWPHVGAVLVGNVQKLVGVCPFFLVNVKFSHH